jgi:hypothetical protein
MLRIARVGSRSPTSNEHFVRAGHAHAGAIVILSLVVQLCVDVAT